MTEQYLIGEVLLLLSRLQAEAHSADAYHQIEYLRADAESTRPRRLGQVLVLAAPLADTLCWEALDAGDVEAFGRRVAIARDIRLFGECSGLAGSG